MATSSRPTIPCNLYDIRSIRLDYAARALRDLRFILQYTEDTWGSDQEEVYRQILQNAFERIRTFPEIGHPVE